MSEILVIDDSLLICKIIQTSLTSKDISVNFSRTGAEGLSLIKEKKPDLILLDVTLPDLNGYEVCTILKGKEETKEIPILFITANQDIDSISKAFGLGAVDFINKPFSDVELKARVSVHLKIKWMTDHLKTLNENLTKALEQNRLMAMEDPLTKLYNRRFAIHHLEELTKIQADPNPIFLLLGDIDNFKRINDQYGHNMGDYVLCAVSKILQETTPPSNKLIARWGGEEFLIVLRNLPLKEVQKISQKICNCVASYPFYYEKTTLFSSITIGIAPFDATKPLEKSIDLADKALYFGKQNGKNRYIFYENRMESL